MYNIILPCYVSGKRTTLSLNQSIYIYEVLYHMVTYSLDYDQAVRSVKQYVKQLTFEGKVSNSRQLANTFLKEIVDRSLIEKLDQVSKKDKRKNKTKRIFTEQQLDLFQSLIK